MAAAGAPRPREGAAATGGGRPYKGAGLCIQDARTGRLLFVRTSNAQHGSVSRWGWPKGRREEVDGGEPLATAVREVAEETGLARGRDYDLVPSAPPRRTGGRYVFFRATLRAEAPTVAAPQFGHSDVVRWAAPAAALARWNLNRNTRDALRAWRRELEAAAPLEAAARSPDVSLVAAQLAAVLQLEEGVRPAAGARARACANES